MITKEILRQVVLKQKSELSLKKETIRRTILDEILHWMKDEWVIVLSGVSRCG